MTPQPVPDLCVELPPAEPPEFLDFSFVARISAADVLFLLDITGSMDGELDEIRRTITTRIIPAMTSAIPSVYFSVATHADFPVNPYGMRSDVPFHLFSRSTSDIDSVQLAMDRIVLAGGRDGRESQVEALFQVATGAGRGRYVLPASCPPERFGYPCFRRGSTPIVLLFTDADFHNGPGGTGSYSAEAIRPAPATYAESVAALRSIGAKVLGLYSGEGMCGQDLRTIARDTGAVTSDGEPICFNIGASGELLDEGTITTVQSLLDHVPIDVDVVLQDWAGDDVDAREFVTRIETRGAAPASSAVDLGDRYDEVLPGTRVDFRIVLANERIPRRAERQVFYLFVTLRGDRVTTLRETVLEIVVPSLGGEGC